jgi:glycosyltransferase involved in cell wall biosynthesis
MRFKQRGDAVSVVVAWAGLPYYAARVVAEAIRRHPEYKFAVISSRDRASSVQAEAVLGQAVHWIQTDRATSWRELGLKPPDLFIITSWPHVAYQTLATEAKRGGRTDVVSMVDNYLRFTLKQLAGFAYFRLKLRPLYSAMWVPGEYSRRFMRFLGVRKENIYTGLYAADHDVFEPPEREDGRHGLLFVGQMIRRKGVDCLATAAVAFPGRLSLRMIGAGKLEPDLRQRGLKVEPPQRPDELAQAYRDASALILPSRLDHWGVVVHEGALCGCLLLVTRQCGACADLVRHRANGYIMRNSSVGEILSAVAWLEGLTEQEIESGRQLSITLARAISPARWADTLDKLVDRFVFGSPPPKD